MQDKERQRLKRQYMEKARILAGQLTNEELQLEIQAKQRRIKDKTN